MGAEVSPQAVGTDRNVAFRLGLSPAKILDATSFLGLRFNFVERRSFLFLGNMHSSCVSPAPCTLSDPVQSPE